MKTVWKFPLSNQVSYLDMPVGAKILHVHEQNGEICLWALVDSEAAKERRQFSIYGTGHPMLELPDDLKYLKYWGTCHIMDGALVFHVFEHVKEAT